MSSGTLFFGALIQYHDAEYGIRLFGLSGDNTVGNLGSVILGQYNGNQPFAAETLYQYLTLRPGTGEFPTPQLGANTGIGINTGTNYLVGKIEFNTSGTKDSVWFWANPTSASQLENNATASASITDPYDLGNMGRFSLCLCLRKPTTAFQSYRFHTKGTPQENLPGRSSL